MSPRKRAPLSRERILAAALALVDREGLDAVSMRRVGEELGVEAMSLYNHVPNKAAILDGVYEAVLAELPPSPPVASWRSALRERASSFRDALRAHPNALPLFATRPAVTQASLAHIEAALDVLRRAGFPARDAFAATQAIVAMVIGHTVANFGPRSTDEPVAPYPTLSPQMFPRLLEVAALAPPYDATPELEFGVDLMIEGLAARLEQAAGARRAKKTRWWRSRAG